MRVSPAAILAFWPDCCEDDSSGLLVQEWEMTNRRTIMSVVALPAAVPDHKGKGLIIVI
jgi:hypothetical protein